MSRNEPQQAGAQKKYELHLYPCVDSLLYFPLYLAIGTWKYRPDFSIEGVTRSNKTTQPTVWTFQHTEGKRKYSVYLHPPAGSDLAAVKQMMEAAKKGKDTLKTHVAIADPLCLLARDTIGDAQNPHSDSNPCVIATMNSRIPMWAVFKKTEQELKIKSKLDQIATRYESSYPPLTEDACAGLKFSWYREGFSNAYLVKRFAPCVENGSFRERNDSDPDNFGIREVADVINGRANVALTNLPGVLTLFRQVQEDQYHCLPVFPSHEIPFTSLICTLRDLSEFPGTNRNGENIDNEEIIGKVRVLPIFVLMEQLAVAQYLVREYLNSVAKFLCHPDVAPAFRHFGNDPQSLRTAKGGLDIDLVNPFDDTRAIIGRLVQHQIFSCHLTNPWPMWQAGLETLTTQGTLGTLDDRYKNGSGTNGPPLKWGAIKDFFANHVTDLVVDSAIGRKGTKLNSDFFINGLPITAEKFVKSYPDPNNAADDRKAVFG